MAFLNIKDITYEYLCSYNRCIGNALKRFWTLWDNIHDVCVVITVATVILQRRFELMK
jgi:hypothetical protein